MSPDVDRPAAAVVNEFVRLWFETGSRQHWAWTHWLGSRIAKFPGDLVVYQEILVETQPDLLVETGTLDGGSALFLATVMDALGRGRVLSVDMEARPGRPGHPRVEYLTGSSTAPDIVAAVTERARRARRVMVVLDSDHRAEHVAAELERYAPLVTPGCYLVVEDTCVNGHPVFDEHGPGPMEALQGFLATHPEFTVDDTREKLLVTFNPRGYLRRAGEAPAPAPARFDAEAEALRDLARRERELTDDVHALRAERDTLHEQLTDEQARHADTQATLDAIRDTKLFRYAAPARRLYARLRRREL